MSDRERLILALREVRRLRKRCRDLETAGRLAWSVLVPLAPVRRE